MNIAGLSLIIVIVLNLIILASNDPRLEFLRRAALTAGVAFSATLLIILVIH